ncbi:RidA family protein [Limisalsivibrio acetivorans]|uniref:RidA family protein n=1 Tax=Limisalsivibrio acetivorans TaxID=1304888 RepID=UPI0003B63385|nr:RidA family protein [Limisalsivibrio acetivorans]
MKHIIATEKAPAAIGPYNQAVAVGNMVYTSGQIPLKAENGEVLDGDIAAQTELVMENLKAVLDKAGCTMADIVKTTCFLSDMGNFGVFNEVYGRYFEDQPPARSCVAVKTLPKNVLVEVEAVAFKE